MQQENSFKGDLVQIFETSPSACSRDVVSIIRCLTRKIAFLFLVISISLKSLSVQQKEVTSTAIYRMAGV